ncbi:N-acetylmuramic acid 6-phosphate etherase [Vaginisenegalia massiliensis]|uniref:N-acetylmuramic acid 6-phosphate etherase n=1 Tax=Vaginisenegalia massiliensis TaxID=2058294 RepID=UPI000F534AC8|nr:N-acetylmuramic acid 6-phosphate etherase [Vaginisenegalia massiliensis]
MEVKDLLELNTERTNPRTRNIDQVATLDMLKMINHEDQSVPQAISQVIPAIGALVDAAYEQMKKGGRLIYVGAGTSGRLGILDASECPPTYGVEPDLVQGIIAGGLDAVFKAQEGAEDSQDGAEKDLREIQLQSHDFVIGLAASGRTPYVIGALEFAHSCGAKTGSIACVQNSRIGQVADYPIDVITGPEVVTGSTRMKAGTAQKLILNMISTSLMIKLGKVYQNYMVDLQPTNHKLENRAIHLIQEILGLDEDRARTLYLDSGKQVKTAILMELAKVDQRQASDLLLEHEGHLRHVLNHIDSEVK